VFRRFQLLVLGVSLLAAAFGTGAPFLFYLVYLSLLVVGGSYVLTRLGLADLEAGYAVGSLSGHVGDRLAVTYTVRNTSRIPKPWLEVHNPASLPGGLPGRAVSIGGRTERSWLVRTPLDRRGHFRIEPMVIRTGDPFGLFESSAAVGSGVTVVVYPRVDPLPLWRLPASTVEGARSAPERSFHATPLATTVRPYAPGDSMNRIHWRSTARHGDIQVKEFELEQTADLWLVLDLDRTCQIGRGEDSTVEVAVRAAASIADRALRENRAVGMTVNARHLGQVPADRGARQRLKIMQLLAAVDGDGGSPLVEALVGSVPRIRHGMTAVVITGSIDPVWVRPLASLRRKGIASVVVSLDQLAFLRADGGLRQTSSPAAPSDGAATEQAVEAALAQRSRALQHTLAEYQIPVYRIVPQRSLSEQLVS
jgi:uncharacterized protein (DUF58 family)